MKIKLTSIFIFLFVLFQDTMLSQDKFRFGLSGGLTCSYAKTTQKNSYGKIYPGVGINIYFPISYKLNSKFSIEAGLGYYINNFKIKYDGLTSTSGHAHPYTPIKFCYSKAIKTNKELFTAIGVTLDYFPVNNTFTGFDSTNQIITVDNSLGKSNQYINFELGFKKITSKNKIHQISLQYFYGLQIVANGTTYHYNNPSESFKYKYSGHFATIQYTFWFGKKPK